MKYQLQPEQPEFNAEGLTVKEGWALIYNVDSATSEYRNASYEYLPVGVSLPASAYLDAPKSVDEKQAIVRNGKKWSYPADYRNQIIYSTETGKQSVMAEIGDIPENYTLLAPTSDFDSWNGKKWLLDETKQHQYYVGVAISKKNELINEATSTISYLQDAIDAEIVTVEEHAAFSAWKKYRVLLNRIDTEKAPDIDWPAKP